MNLTGRTVLVFLEEDNTQRAYFRIRPLLTEEGPVDKASVEQFPDDGYLRIVPDKNEQHTFKERMRTLAPICLLDLAGLNPDVQKIRSNKNYSPAKGEKNQFIVYSDAVKPLDRQYYQVVSENQLSSALTPLAYTRSGANIQGPFDRENGTLVGDMTRLPPDTPRIFTVTLPDGKELLFYCAVPKAEEAPQEDLPGQPEPDASPAAEEKLDAGVSKTPPAPNTSTDVSEPDTAAAVPEQTAPAEEQAPPVKEKAVPAQEQAAPVSIWKQQVDAMISGKPIPAPSAPSAAPSVSSPAPSAPAPAPSAPSQASAAPSASSRKQPAERLHSRPEAGPKKNLKPDPAPGTALDKIQALNGSLKVRSASLREERSSLPVQAEANDRPIGGTKLYKPAMEKKNNPRNRNDLTEAVDQLRNVSRYESRAEAPGAVISDPGRIGSLPNPVEQFRFILKRVWSLPDTHRQVADTILATSGMRQSLSRILTEGKSSLTVRAMQSQLQELEAERLMTLMQLDDAKGSLQKLKDRVAVELAADKSSRLHLLEEELKEKEMQIASALGRQEALTAARDEALKAAEVFPWQHTLAAPAAGSTDTDLKTLSSRVADALSAAGFAANGDTALILLALLAICPGTLGICTGSAADSCHAFRTIVSALGAAGTRVQTELEFTHPIRVEAGGDGFVFTYGTAPLRMQYPGLVHFVGGEADDVYLSKATDADQDRYLTDPWPVFWITASPDGFASDPAPQPTVPSSLVRELLLPGDEEMDASAAQLLSQLRITLNNANAPLPVATATRMRTFILVLKDRLSGGIADAIDWAFMCFVVPHIRYNGIDPQVLLPFVGAMPRTFRELSK